MDVNELRLNCWVRSEGPGGTFRIQISGTKTVFDLQKAIKNENSATFQNVDADALRLYKPTTPVFRPFKDNLRKVVLSEHAEFLEECELSEIFPEPPKPGIHVIVDAPSAIVCWVRNATPNSSFRFPIRPGEGTGQLISRIRDDPNLSDLAHQPIRLYRISGDENELRECLNQTGGGELIQGATLTMSFLSVPVLDPLRVVIEVDQGQQHKRKRDDDIPEGFKRLKRAVCAGAPSSVAPPATFQRYCGPTLAIACNRPFERTTLPLALFHEAFGIFRDRCKRTPSLQALAFLEKLAPTACKWYADETGRRSAINAIFREYLDVQFHEEKVPDTEYTTDGNLTVTVMPAAIRVCKNERGDALNQVILYYCQFLHSAHMKRFHNVKTTFPCILIVDIGPLMGFYGAAWNGECTMVEPLSPMFNLMTHAREEDARHVIASCFDAFIAAKENIKTHYESINAEAKANQASSAYDLGVMEARLFPFLTSYNDNGTEMSFTYKERVHEDKLVFSAIVNQPGSGECIVKFTQGYSEPAHRHLASCKMAPKIWKCIRMSANWTAVVMEKSKYQTLYGMWLSNSEQVKVIQKVMDIVRTLHKGGFVHGDIRDMNLLVDHSSLTSDDVKVHLIDFDWAGHVGEVRYPANVNCETVKRAEGVKGGEVITQQHDNEMVSYLFKD